MNIYYFAILAFWKLVCVEEHTYQSASPLTSFAFWIDRIGSFPSMYVLIHVGSVASDSMYRTQVVSGPRFATVPFDIYGVNGPVSKAYIPRLVRLQMSPFQVLPPPVAPTCVNRHLIPSFEVPGLKSYAPAFPPSTCEIDDVTFQAALQRISGLSHLLVVAAAFSLMLVHIARVCVQKNIPHVQAATRSLLVTPTFPEAAHLAPGNDHCTPPAHTLTPSPNTGLSDSTLALSSTRADPTSSAVVSSTTASTSLISSNLSMDAADRSTPAPLPRPVLRTSLSLLDGLNIWAPVFVPMPAVVAPTPRRPFICAFAGVNAGVRSMHTSSPTPIPTQQPTPSRPIEDMLVRVEARNAGIHSSRWASAPGPAPAALQSRRPERTVTVKLNAPPSPLLECGKSILFSSPRPSPSASLAASSSATPASTMKMAPTQSRFSCEERDEGISKSMHARPAASTSPLPSAPAPSLVFECENRASGLSKSMHAPPASPSHLPTMPSTSLSSPLRREEKDVGLNGSIYAPSSSPTLLPALPPSPPSPPLRCEERAVGLNGSIHAPPTLFTPLPAPPPPPPSPPLRCEERAVGLNRSIHAPPTLFTPLSAMPPPLPSPPLQCEERAVGLNISMHAPPTLFAPLPAMPPPPPSPPLRCEERAVGLNRSMHAPPAAPAPLIFPPPPSPSPPLRCEERDSGLSASRWAPQPAQQARTQPQRHELDSKGSKTTSMAATRACGASPSAWAPTPAPSAPQPKRKPYPSVGLTASIWATAPASTRTYTAAAPSTSLQSSRWAPVVMATITPAIAQ
ncbi:hypothetical protein FPV67DRAFT_1700888 [Lyophyllum atratum]|nr:hypothetical protein FPV67DRAFT_1700888 [Lyophyllum atratum]